MSEYEDFKEIAHCGGKITFDIACDAEGRRSYSLGFVHDWPTPAAWIGIYASSQGIAVADFRIGGEGGGFEPQPPEDTFPVFLGSDSRLCWGHQCPRCHGYFRNGIHPATYPLICPYCGLRTNAWRFLTASHKIYIKHYVTTLLDALEAQITPDTSRRIIIDVDTIAAQGANEPKPQFYYTTESQQTRYRCDHCNDFNDIRGRYGYCASCGWRNNLQLLGSTFSEIRERLNARQVGPPDVVRSAVSEFDACCRDMLRQISLRVPMKPGRRTHLDRLMFYDLNSAAIGVLKDMFEVDLLRGMGDDSAFLNLMMHRRHVFEHNGGVADERYCRESGDPDARLGVLIRETQVNAHRLIGSLTRIVHNFDRDFHEIFPPTAAANCASRTESSKNRVLIAPTDTADPVDPLASSERSNAHPKRKESPRNVSQTVHTSSPPHSRERRSRRLSGDRGTPANAPRRSRECAQLPAPEIGRDARDRREHHLDLAAHEIGNRRRRALIGNMHDVDTGHRLEQLAGEMRRRADPVRAEVDAAGPGPRGGDQILDVVDRQARVDDDDIERARHQGDRRKGAERIVRQLGIERRIDRVGERRHQQRVAVWGARRHRGGADDGAGARLVLDDDRLAEIRGHRLAEPARNNICAPAGRERHDDADEAVGIGGVGGGCCKAESDEQRGDGESKSRGSETAPQDAIARRYRHTFIVPRREWPGQWDYRTMK
jgi:hypothetical protein